MRITGIEGRRGDSIIDEFEPRDIEKGSEYDLDDGTRILLSPGGTAVSLGPVGLGTYCGQPEAGSSHASSMEGPSRSSPPTISQALGAGERGATSRKGGL